MSIQALNPELYTTYIYICRCICISTYTDYVSMSASKYVRMSVSMSVYIYIYIYVCLYACMYGCMHVRR